MTLIDKGKAGNATTHIINITPLIDYMLAIYVIVSNLNENGLNNADKVADIVKRLAIHIKASVGDNTPLIIPNEKER